MEEFLFTIDSTFRLNQHGIILEPGAPYNCPVRVGERIELRRPDGTRLTTSIIDIEHMNYPLATPIEYRRIPILITATSGFEATLIGTEVWRT